VNSASAGNDKRYVRDETYIEWPMIVAPGKLEVIEKCEAAQLPAGMQRAVHGHGESWATQLELACPRRAVACLRGELPGRFGFGRPHRQGRVTMVHGHFGQMLRDELDIVGTGRGDGSAATEQRKHNRASLLHPTAGDVRGS
jgi:hypothetical protein